MLRTDEIDGIVAPLLKKGYIIPKDGRMCLNQILREHLATKLPEMPPDDLFPEDTDSFILTKTPSPVSTTIFIVQYLPNFRIFTRYIQHSQIITAKIKPTDTQTIKAIWKDYRINDNRIQYSESSGYPHYTLFNGKETYIETLMENNNAINMRFLKWIYRNPDKTTYLVIIRE